LNFLAFRDKKKKKKLQQIYNRGTSLQSTMLGKIHRDEVSAAYL
jgi:hypothetical protein